LTGAIVKLAIRVLAIHVLIAPLRIRQTGDLHRRSGQIDLGGRIRVVACPRALHQEVAGGPFEEGREIPGFAVVVLLVKGIGDLNTAGGVKPEITANALALNVGRAGAAGSLVGGDTVVGSDHDAIGKESFGGNEGHKAL